MLISELATATNETPRTLRFYEAAGVLPKPPRTRGGYRDYPASAIARVRFIRSLQRVDLTLDEIATVTRVLDSTSPPCSTDMVLLETTMGRIDNHLDILARMHRELATLLDPTATRRPDGTHRRTPSQTDRLNT